MKFLSQLKPNQLRNKICLLRVDLNIQNADLYGLARGFIRVPLKITAILPTIKFLTGNEAKVVILSHRGRPQKTKNLKLKTGNYSLKPFAKIFSQLLKKPVRFIDFGISQKLKSEIENSPVGSVFLLENLRFFAEEENNDKRFAEKLASLGDIYVNDAFAVSHRENASVSAITEFLPSYVGLVLEKEVENLNSATAKFKKPLIVILGGAKVSDKVGLIDNFSKKADYFLIGGAMANTFFASQGLPVGDSLYEKEVDLAGMASRLGRKIVLPRDTVIYRKQILDIGPETIKEYQKFIKNAGTIVWNGPMGLIENERFAKGTKEIAAAILKNKNAETVIGGGETIASLNLKAINYKLKANVFISTGGGAMLEYLAGKKLPGLEALNNLKINE